jgi:TonB family protein
MKNGNASGPGEVRALLRRALLVGMFGAILAWAGGSPAVGAPESRTLTSSRAPDSVRVVWRSWLLSSDSLKIKHAETMQHPVPFTTRLPCHDLVTHDHANDVVRGESVRALCGLLADALLAAGDGRCSNCPLDSARHNDVVDIEIATERDTLRMSLEPQLSQLGFRDRSSAFWWCSGLGSRAGPILGALVELLPDDHRLPEIVPCTDSLDPGRGTETVPGMMVYVETLPEAIGKVAPHYPEEARSKGVEATTIVRALVGRDGRVRETLLPRTEQRFRPLQRSAVEALEQWTFKPASSNGKPVAVWVAIPIRFTLR